MDWRVFFIGPMSPPLDQNLPRLRRMVFNYLVQKRKYKRERRGDTHTVFKGDDRITVIVPQDDRLPTGSIPQSVFHQIDNADLVVADLTGGRAAVAYELAMAHALGVYTALVGKKPAEDLMFYLTQYKLLEIDLTEAAYADEAALPPEEMCNAIDRWLTDRFNVSGAQNPFSTFYGAPLYDISAASGLAAGFYLNFAQPILVSGKLLSPDPKPAVDGAAASDSPTEIRGLIVLRPERLTDNIPIVENGLKELLEAEFGSEQIKSGQNNQLVVQTEQGKRTAFYAVNGYLIDIPRTMFSLDHCYRLERLKNIGHSDSATRDRLSSNMQEILIDRFFEDLARRAQRDGRMFHTRQLLVGKVDQIPEIIRSGQPPESEKPATSEAAKPRRKPRK